MEGDHDSQRGANLRWRRTRTLLRRRWCALRRRAWIWLGLCVLLLYFLFGAVVYRTLPHWQERGQFGDMFGAANALFSALAFAGVVYAIWLQREELRLQRRELRLTRQQIAQQTRAYAQRLAIEQAALRPLLRLVRISSWQFKRDTDFGTKIGFLSLELANDGGPMYHAIGRLLYRKAIFVETPTDQDYEVELSAEAVSAADPLPAHLQSSMTYSIPKNGTCHLGLHFVYPEGHDLKRNDFDFIADVIITYINALSEPRVADYRLAVNPVGGKMILIRDLDVETADQQGLLDEYPPSYLPAHMRRGRKIELEDLYPDLD